MCGCVFAYAGESINFIKITIMDEQDFQDLNDDSWDSWVNNEISPDELDKQLEDNQAEYDRYGY